MADAPMDPKVLDRFREQAKDDEKPVDVAQVDRYGKPLLRADGTPVVLKVVGEWSAKFLANQRERRDAVSRGELDTTDEIAFHAWMGSCGVVGWTLDYAGADVPFSTANVIEYLKAAPWNIVKAKNGATERADFFAAGSSN